MFEAMSGLEKFFLVCAVIGGLLFLVKFIAELIGFGEHGDVPIDVGNSDVSSAEAAESFKILTLQSLTAFFMMFGLVGFVMSNQGGINVVITFIASIAAGVGTVWAIAAIFSRAKKLQASGTMQINDMLGAQGSVYQRIAEGGVGKVTVTVKGRQREYEAVSADKKELKTGDTIKVVDISGDRLIVEKIN
ncbi:MAG: hypothetical protein OEV59_02645 [Deltaproteobacteria bacterium]|nr:hypothetical protein [Deltaproteobacteria bacterium]